jgi:hypothetical protein
MTALLSAHRSWALVGIFFAIMLVAMPVPVRAQTAARPVIALTVDALGTPPGFKPADLPRYLAARMQEAGLAAWQFAPAAEHAAPSPDRVEWRFRLNPYAGGHLREFIPVPTLQRLFAVHRLITVELRLYLDGEYQTATLGQATIQGGPDDKNLAAFVVQLSQQLLDETGAYRAIDTGGKARP